MITRIYIHMCIIIIDTARDQWCDEVDTSVPSERIVVTNENTPSTIDSNNNNQDNNNNGDDDDDDDDDDSNNSVYGTTCSVLSTFILLFTATLVA